MYIQQHTQSETGIFLGEALVTPTPPHPFGLVQNAGFIQEPTAIIAPRALQRRGSYLVNFGGILPIKSCFLSRNGQSKEKQGTMMNVIHA